MSFGIWQDTVWPNFMTLYLQMAEITAKQQKRARFWHWAIWRPIRVFVKIKILKFRFFHVTRNTIRYVVAKFLGPRISNGWDYREQPILAQKGTPALENHNFEKNNVSMSLGAYKGPVCPNFMVLSFKMAEIIANNGKIENGSKLTLDPMGRYS